MKNIFHNIKNMIGVVYKLYCDNAIEFYIGSSEDFAQRKREHKSSCYNQNKRDYKYDVYKYIRANGGFKNWKFLILEENEFENNKVLKIKEQHYINLLKPTLNCKGAILDIEKQKATHRKCAREYNNVKVICECGIEYSRGNKTIHINSKKHQKLTLPICNITNNFITLTININK